MLYVSPKTQHVLLLTSIKTTNFESCGGGGGGGDTFARPDALALLSLVSRQGSWENMGLQVLASHVVNEPVPPTIVFACLPHVSTQSSLWSSEEERESRVTQAVMVTLAQLDISKTRERCPRCHGTGAATEQERADRNGAYVCCIECEGEGLVSAEPKTVLSDIMRMANLIGKPMSRYQIKTHFLPLLKEVMNVLLYAAAIADEQVRVAFRRERGHELAHTDELLTQEVY